MKTSRPVLKISSLVILVSVLIGLSLIFQGSALATSGGTNKIFSFLGDDPKPSILDQDLFEFQGTKGEMVTLTLERDLTGSYSGKQANLSLFDNIYRTWSLRKTTGDLPRSLTTTLPTTGKYLILIAELPGLKGVESFRGGYCLSLTSSKGAYLTFRPTPWVESSGNSAPVAHAGPDQTVSAGYMVTLDGSKSCDVDGDRLTFHWSFLSAPAGSTAALCDPTAVKPTFVVDKPGTYVVQLIVNDGTVDSLPDTVTISTQNSRPVAKAGRIKRSLLGIQ